MRFTHKPVDLPKLDRETIDGVRYYKVPESNGDLVKLVSITSVTSHYKKEFFQKWRNKVGAEEADRITKRATSRGTDMHTLTEYYLNNDELPEVNVPISKILFNTAKPALNKIDNILAQEASMYSLKLGIAGTVDCIAEYEGELAIIDFKTSKAVKPVEWIEGYFVQASAYACMLYELTGIKAKKLIIIMACEDGDLKVYEERDVFKWVTKLDQYIRKFVNDKLNSYG
jgi:hypothetical protein